MDNYGHHVIIIINTNELYYLHSKFIKPKKINMKIHHNIESISFNKYLVTELYTNSFVLGILYIQYIYNFIYTLY